MAPPTIYFRWARRATRESVTIAVMPVTQHLKSGLTIRQDFRDAARLVFFATDDADLPFWSPGGTAFVVNYQSRPYVVTCKHILDQAQLGAEPVITDQKFGRTPIKAAFVHGVRDPTGEILDADMGDVAVIDFADEVSAAVFSDTAYLVDEGTIGTSDLGHTLLVHGTLRERCQISQTEISPHFATFEFEDLGATSEDPYIRTAHAKFAAIDLNGLAGLSGSPVFDNRLGSLCGMVVRGGLSADGASRIHYVDFSDILKLIESVRVGELRVSYTKDVKRWSKRP